jgi:hypothetical protein
MSRICLYYRKAPEPDRWIPGDHAVRAVVRRVVRGKPRMGGVDKVFYNLRLGLDQLGVEYLVNLPFKELRKDDRVGVLGRGRYSLQGYDRANPIVAGIGLMTHPSEWPTLCEDYPVTRYLQHSQWANDVYRPYFGDRCGVWPVGIDTDSWAPAPAQDKDIDLLIYDKVMWNHDIATPPLDAIIRNFALRQKLVVAKVTYGQYAEQDYRSILSRSKAMIFLCEHESQGLAYQECMASGVPVLAWDQGHYLDPHRLSRGQPEISATSVPYFDERCGERFLGTDDFGEKLSIFIDRIDASAYRPRDFVLENLTLKGCAAQFLSFLDENQ